MQRLNKFIASSGLCSRRKADEYIENGDVVVNGRIVKELGFQVGPKDKVSVEGKLIKPLKLEYYRFYKPAGYITTSEDEKGRKTVLDLLPNNNKRLFPVGRLDYDSEGLLILTNDGDLTFKLTHPKNEIPKTYLVKTEKPVSDADLVKLRSGVVVDGVKTKKCNVKLLETVQGSSRLTVTITEGRNRQIRKMFEQVDNNVDFLKRIKIGDLTVSGLNRGEVRALSASEINYLKNI